MTDVAALTDDRIDELVRGLSRPGVEGSRAERTRTELLAITADVSPTPARSPWILAASVAIPLAVAAVGLMWLSMRAGTSERETSGGLAGGNPVDDAGAREEIPTPALARVTADGPAVFEREHDASGEQIRISDGRLIIDVATGGRVQVSATDAVVIATRGRFEVAAQGSVLVAVVVHEGRVELRSEQSSVLLVAGERWDAAVPALEPAAVPALEPAAVPAGEPVEPVESTGADRGKSGPRASAPSDVALDLEAAGAVVQPPATANRATAPGEEAFRRGWSELRAGEAAAASASFDSACIAIATGSLGEDACYWAGVAAKRAGKTGRARRYLERFLKRYASSARAGEAAALLGWLLLDAGKLETAQRHFERAAQDSVPKVRASAEAGLAAIAEKRTN